MTRLCVAAMLVFATSCVARTVRPSPAMLLDLGRAHALVNDGCHQCLQDALVTFEHVAAAPNAPVEAARGAFRTAVLLVMRSRELGLPGQDRLAVAQSWAERLPPVPGAAGDVPAAVILDALRLVSGETSGLSPEERERRNAERRALWSGQDEKRPAVRVALDQWLGSDLVAQYVALGIDCENAWLRRDVKHEEIVARFPQPLMRFRLALCAIPNVLVDPLRQNDPRWVDTLYFEARREMSRFPAPDLGRAAELFQAAHDAFPTSTAITLALGNVRNALEEFVPALTLFDSILRAEPAHREALLGRLLSLSYLKRHYDAIRTATQMIELGMYHMGDAYYWRAWNRYQVHDLPLAWSDVEAANTLMVNTAVYTLAGFIAYAQRELDTAIDRLARAYRIDSSNCEAVWTEGMVRVDTEEWASAASRFTTSMACFAADAKLARDELQTAANATWVEAVKARRIATARKRAESSDHRHAQSAFNAASSYLRLGRKADALAYVGIAASHQLLKDKAGALRQTIEKLP
jgi:tetratricopeptide (TPR) repeat protein